MFFNDINHGYRATMLKENPLWLLPSHMAVVTSCYYENLRRTMRTAIVSYPLNSNSHLRKEIVLLVSMKPFKNDEKCFLFNLRSSVCSHDISVFVLTFWSCRKNGLIRKIRLILKFMSSKLG